MAKSLTATNAVITLAVPPIFTAPQNIEEFATDDVFNTDETEPTEISMGLDGVMSAGYIFVPVKQAITLQANSPSNDVFDLWKATQDAAGDQFFAQGYFALPSLRRAWIMTGGALSAWTPMPGVGKVARPRRFSITWERTQAVPFG